MPVKPEDRMSAAREAMEMYQLQSQMADPIKRKYAKMTAPLKTGLNLADPSSFASQAITAVGGNPLDYTTGALVGKGVKAIANAVKK